jgi:hypothetical protein
LPSKLIVALYVGLVVGMIVLYVVNLSVAWIFIDFMIVAVFGGLMLKNRPAIIAAGFLVTSLILMGAGLCQLQQSGQTSAWPTAPGVITDSFMCTVRTFALGLCPRVHSLAGFIHRSIHRQN